jgi:hypothetical protein
VKQSIAELLNSLSTVREWRRSRFWLTEIGECYGEIALVFEIPDMCDFVVSPLKVTLDRGMADLFAIGANQVRILLFIFKNDMQVVERE